MPLTLAAAHRKDLSDRASTMTHQHFRTIAAILRDQMERYPITTPPVIDAFADALALTNPRFNRARFVAACVPESCAALTFRPEEK